MEECVILGGGVAGLCAANQLVDEGMSPLIIDGGEYPCHRVCGEYLSHECLPILEKWQIPLTRRFTQVRLIHRNKTVEFQLPIPAGGCPRYEFDAKLFNRALKKGARAHCKTMVEALNHAEGHYELKLSTQQVIKARHLIIGAGRFSSPLKPKYFGFKAHFEGVEMDESLEMHLFPGGYLGMDRIGPNAYNVAILAHQPIHFPQLLESMPLLKARMKNGSMLYPEWLSVRIPEFGIRSNPAWERVYWVGDAAGGIPPISGQGLAIAVTSGCMAAEYILKQDARQFRADWLKRYRKRYFWACQIHKAVAWRAAAIQACTLFPKLPGYLWKLTRE